MNDIEYIRAATPETEVLAQLVEECCELAQAALKLRRACKPHGGSPTPCSVPEAVGHLREEVADVLVCMQVAGLVTDISAIPLITEIAKSKTKRWARRLGREEEELE